MARFCDELDDEGHRLVVRNGRAQEPRVTVGSGTLPVRAPRVNDKRAEEETGERRRFSSKILPAYARRSPNVTDPSITTAPRWRARVWPPWTAGARQRVWPEWFDSDVTAPPPLDIAAVIACCEQRIPHALHHVRMEAVVDRHAVTLVERHSAVASPSSGPSGREAPVARLRWSVSRREWMLWRDRNHRWHHYKYTAPTTEMARLLEEDRSRSGRDLLGMNQRYRAFRTNSP